MNSPGNGIPEPANGVVPFAGYANVIFNGTFAPGSNTISATNASIGEFNNNGMVSGNAIDASNSVSTFEHFIGSYFDVTGGVSNFSISDWSWTYTNSTYPANVNKWVDSNALISGDIVVPLHVTGQSVNVTVNLPSNTPIALNYTSAGAVLTITSSNGNTISANVLIANLTSGTTGGPSATGTTFTKQVVLNVNSSIVSNSVVYELTVNYPCGSNSAPYKYNKTTGAWVAITPVAYNKTNAPVSCSMSFTIPPDPVIGLFSSAPTPVVNSGGGAPTPAGAATSTPSVTPTSNGYVISNLTTPNSETVSLEGKSITITVSSISPGSAVVIVNGVSENLSPNVPVQVDPPAFLYYIELAGISYAPAEHTITLNIYSVPNATTTATSTVTVVPATTTAPSPATSIAITTVAPAAAAAPSSFSSTLFGIIAGIVVIAVVAAMLYLRRRKGTGGRKQDKK